MRIPRLRLRLVTAIIITISDLRRQKQLAKDGKGGSSLAETIYHDRSLGNSIGGPDLLKLANYSPYMRLSLLKTIPDNCLCWGDRQCLLKQLRCRSEIPSTFDILLTISYCYILKKIQRSVCSKQKHHLTTL